MERRTARQESGGQEELRVKGRAVKSFIACGKADRVLEIWIIYSEMYCCLIINNR